MLNTEKRSRHPRLAALFLWAGLFPGAATVPAREFPPSVLPPKPYTLPVPPVRELPNGLKVVVIERHSLPLLTLHLVVKVGAEADPPDLPGTAQLVASLLDQGTVRRSAQEIAESIDSVGGTIETGADWDNSFATVTVLSDHIDFAFDLLADIVTRPVFGLTEVERKRKQTLSALEVLRDEPGYLADTTFSRMIFDGTSYSHPADGTLEAVRRVATKDLRDFHALYYLPSNAMLAVVGDISSDEGLRLAEKFFGGWGGGSKRDVAPRPLPSVRSRQVVVIDKPDAVQTEIRIGNPGIARDDPDYYALTIANQILGGPAANRLFRALRSRQGLTYSASSEIVCHRHLGSWLVKTSTRTPETITSIRVSLEQIKRLREHPITNQELESAKGYLIGHLALDFETSEGVAGHVLDLMLNNLPLDYWNRFPEKIRALGADEVWSATGRYLDPDRNLIVLVGDARGFKKDLKKLGPLRVIPLRSLDFSSANLERPASPPGKQ